MLQPQEQRCFFLEVLAFLAAVELLGLCVEVPSHLMVEEEAMEAPSQTPEAVQD